MQNNRLSNTKLNAYIVARKYVNSFTGFGLVALVLLSVLALGQLTFDPANSLMLNGQLDGAQWVSALVPAVAALSLIYSLLTSPLELAANAVVPDEKDVKVYNSLLTGRKTTIPYAAIENVELKQTLLQRSINFARISVNYDGENREELATLPKDQAKQLVKKIAHNSAVVRMQSA